MALQDTDLACFFILNLKCTKCGLKKQAKCSQAGAPALGSILGTLHINEAAAHCMRCRSATMEVMNAPQRSVPQNQPIGWKKG